MADVVRHLRNWQFNPKATSPARFRFDANLAAHSLHPLFGDGQAHARPAMSRGIAQGLKNVKNALLVLPRNPDAVVFDPQAHR
jgi:hypothetical protein